MDASKWVDLTVGDGSISVVLLTGALLARAEELMRQEIHPSSIIDGVRRGGAKGAGADEGACSGVRPPERAEHARPRQKLHGYLDSTLQRPSFWHRSWSALRTRSKNVRTKGS